MRTTQASSTTVSNDPTPISETSAALIGACGATTDLTSGFAGLAARYVALPALGVAPVIQVAIGYGFQMQTGDNFHCNNGVVPTDAAECLLSVKDVASALAVSTATVYGLCDSGKLPHVRVLNVIRVRPPDLRGFIAAGIRTGR